MVKYDVENLNILRKTIQRAVVEAQDLSPAFDLIADDFYKSQKAIFKLKSKGGYVDLSEGYKRTKRKKFGSIYPILKASGRLERSTTNRSDREAFQFTGKKFMTIRSAVPYAKFLNKGTSKMPARPFFLVGPESRAFQDLDRKGLGGRLTRWTNIINDYVEEAAKRVENE